MKKAFLIVISFITISCNSSTVNIDKGLVKELAKSDFNIPSVHGALLLFVSINKSQKGCTNVNILHEIFLKHYSENYMTFEAFLFDALNQEILFSQKELGKYTPVFNLNKIVTEKHTHSKTQDFINTYCDKIANDRFIVKKEYITNEYLYSILYYSFINNYQITSDDYNGEYFITKKNININGSVSKLLVLM